QWFWGFEVNVVGCSREQWEWRETEGERDFRFGGKNVEQCTVVVQYFKTKKKIAKSQTMTPTLPKSQGPKASESLLQKRKKPLPKKAPKETKETPPPRQRRVPTDKVLPFTASNEGTAKTTPHPEGPLGEKDSEGNKPPTDMEPIHPTIADPSRTGAEYQVDETQPTRLRYQTVIKNKGKTSSEERDEEKVFAARDDMEEETQADKEEHQEQTDKLVQAIIDSLDKTATDRELTFSLYINTAPNLLFEASEYTIKSLLPSDTSESAKSIALGATSTGTGETEIVGGLKSHTLKLGS
nr:hypothetical protein [Tanacetum cinerariifolium]